MPSLLSPLVYVTVADARATSNVFPANPTLTDANLEKILVKAQWLIDNYIVRYPTKAVDGQPFIFPTVDDGVPTDISLATVRIAEQLYLTSGSTIAPGSSQKVVSESNMSRSVSYSDSQSYDDYINTVGLPPEALAILDKYKNNFIGGVM